MIVTEIHWVQGHAEICVLGVFYDMLGVNIDVVMAIESLQDFMLYQGMQSIEFMLVHAVRP
jgi:hypothetical protein